MTLPPSLPRPGHLLDGDEAQVLPEGVCREVPATSQADATQVPGGSDEVPDESGTVAHSPWLLSETQRCAIVALSRTTR